MNSFSTINCPHFGPCAGCTQSGDVSRPPILKQVEESFASYGLVSEHHVGPACGWRVRAKLAIRACDGRTQVGLFRARSHNLLPIPLCQVHHPKINQARKVLEQVIQEHRLEPYDEVNGTGLCRYAQFTVERASERVQLALVLNREENLEGFLDDLTKRYDWHSIWFNDNREKTNIIFGPRWHHCRGAADLKQNLLGVDLTFHPGAFMQANFALFEKLVSDLSATINPQACVVEFYAGVGAIGATLSKRGIDVVCTDLNPFPHPGLSYVQGLTDERLELLEGRDTVIVDPPREGLSKKLIERLIGFKGELYYISCSFRSFKRDMALLLQGGWRVVKADTYLFFPGTDHVEILAKLQSG